MTATSPCGAWGRRAWRPGAARSGVARARGQPGRRFFDAEEKLRARQDRFQPRPNVELPPATAKEDVVTQPEMTPAPPAPEPLPLPSRGVPWPLVLLLAAGERASDQHALGEGQHDPESRAADVVHPREVDDYTVLAAFRQPEQMCIERGYAGLI